MADTLSQSDLDELLALTGPDDTPAHPSRAHESLLGAAGREEEAAPPADPSATSDSLSQDEIDRLLAEFGK